MSENFSFLENIELSEVSPSQQGRAKRAESNPTNADLRVFADGSIYPSAKLVEDFNLEYQGEKSDVVENGFDLIDSKLWGMLPEGTPRFLAIATVSRASARKPMLFGKFRLKDGKPVQSVLDQGAVSAGKILLSYLETVLDIKMGDEPYLDLNLLREHKITSANGIYMLPYTQQKGVDAGTIKSVRRENCEIYPLVVATVKQVDELPMEEATEEVEN